MNPLPILALAAFLSITPGFVVAADPGRPPADAPTPIPLERIHADPPLQGRLPQEARLSPGGGYLAYLQAAATDGDELELWVLPLPSGSARRLASVADLTGGRDAILSEGEKAALERRRMWQRGITGFEWCGVHDQRIVVPLGGDLYLLDLPKAAAMAGLVADPAAGQAARTQRLSFGDGEPARDPHCDPTGQRLAYVRLGDLWVRLLDGSPPQRLTHTGGELLSTGLAEFIAAEEFDRFDGYWWSPDGRQLLALEVDEAPVPVKQRMQIRADDSQVVAQRYPAAGERNAQVQALVIDVESGRTRRLQSPPGTEYIVRAGWFADGTPWLQTMVRDQTELHLVDYAGEGEQPRRILVERDPAWVEAGDDLQELEGRPLSGKPALLWSSEASGRRQLVLVDRVSGAMQALTSAPEPVTRVVCANASRIVWAGATLRGRGRELFETGLHAAQGTPARIIDPGDPQRWRSAKGDRSCDRLLVRESGWAQPPRLRIVALDGAAPPTDLAGDPPDPLLQRIVPGVQALEFTAADGRTALNAFYMPPLGPGGTASARPVIVSVYGGPGSIDVGWYWHWQAPLFAHWQRLGFGVLLIDNRGTAGRDRDFTRAHLRAFGQVDIADLYAVARQLPARIEHVAPDRIGLIGWSYGGFLAARAVLDEDTPFAAAVAGAPVVDWTSYDSAYTERHLGHPASGNAAPYREANLALRAHRLSRPLMLMHGTADDNVLFEHSLKLMQALQREGKLFETVIYPGQTHGLASRQLRLHADRAATDFLVRRLRP